MRIILLIFWIVTVAEGQLNYNGNPLTENTEYTAEESQKHDVYDTIATGFTSNELNNNHNHRNNHNTNHYNNRNTNNYDGNNSKKNRKKIVDSFTIESTGSHLANTTKEKLPKTTTIDIPVPPAAMASVVPANVQLKNVSGNNNAKLMVPSAMMHQAYTVNPSITVLDSTSSMQMQSREEYSTKNQRDNTEKNIRVTPRQIASSAATSQALNSFLNSQTPEESRYTLDKYLQVLQHANQQQTPVQFDSSSLNVQNYNPNTIGIGLDTKNTNFLSHPLQIQDVNQPISTDLQFNDLSNLQSMSDIPTNAQKIYQTQPIRPTIQSYWYTGVKNQANRLTSGMRPYYYHHYQPPGYIGNKYGQPRIGSEYAPQGPPLNIPVTYSPYTKRTHRRYGPYAAGPTSPGVYPAPYPGVTNPPIDTNVRFSQLYAQSYDPYYYDYIAKTGKIKPWLYGKLGSNYREEPSMWKELYQGFKKHGMKNIMNPMFLLGLSIPALTLMLSAIITKRSFGRSADSGNYLNEDMLNELEEKVRAAIEYYKVM